MITIAGVSALDNNSSLANAGVAYVMLKDWSLRGKGEDLLSLYTRLNRELAAATEADVLVLPPPPIQGIGNAGGFTMQVELRDGSFDLAKLRGERRRHVGRGADANRRSSASSPRSAPACRNTGSRSIA